MQYTFDREGSLRNKKSAIDALFPTAYNERNSNSSHGGSVLPFVAVWREISRLRKAGAAEEHSIRSQNENRGGETGLKKKPALFLL